VIAKTVTISHERIAAMLTYLSTVWEGEAAPLWPHVVLLSVSILAAFAVGFGILLESPKYSAAVHKLATWLVLGGIGVESLCTVLLFVFDERISARQDSVISAQNTEIISLQRRLAARTLSDQQASAIAEKVRTSAGQTFQVIAYWKIPESLALAERIGAILTAAGWKIDQPKSFTTIIDVVAGVIIDIDANESPEVKVAANSLLEALRANDVFATLSDTFNRQPPSHKINIAVGIKQ
jgi:hypothetical protein